MLDQRFFLGGAGKWSVWVFFIVSRWSTDNGGGSRGFNHGEGCNQSSEGVTDLKSLSTQWKEYVRQGTTYSKGDEEVGKNCSPQSYDSPFWELESHSIFLISLLYMLLCYLKTSSNKVVHDSGHVENVSLILLWNEEMRER